MDGITALDLSDLVSEVLHSSLNQPTGRVNLCRNEQSEKNAPTQKKQRNTQTRWKILD